MKDQLIIIWKNLFEIKKRMDQMSCSLIREFREDQDESKNKLKQYLKEKLMNIELEVKDIQIIVQERI